MIPQQSLNNPQKSLNDMVNKKYICDYCEQNFTQSCHLSRHSKICREKNLKLIELETEFEKYKQVNEFEKYKKEMESEIILLKEKLRSVEDHNKTLKNENKFQKQIIESAGGMIKKSMNTMSYLLLNYNNAPQLQSLVDYSNLQKNNDLLIKDLIHYHRKGNLEKYIGDFIIKQYKKDDPKLQSLWSSDVERLNYFIRELIKNNPDINDTSNKVYWINDKKGIKVKKCIIDPLLDYIHNIGSIYLNEKNAQISNLDTVNATRIVTDMQNIGEINCGIKNNTVAENINKYIAPHFYLNKEQNNNNI